MISSTIFHLIDYLFNLTFPNNAELNRRRMRSGGGPKGRNEFERFVRAFHSMKYLLCDDEKYNHEDIN